MPEGASLGRVESLHTDIMGFSSDVWMRLFILTRGMENPLSEFSLSSLIGIFVDLLKIIEKMLIDYLNHES